MFLAGYRTTVFHPRFSNETGSTTDVHDEPRTLRAKISTYQSGFSLGSCRLYQVTLPVIILKVPSPVDEDTEKAHAEQCASSSRARCWFFACAVKAIQSNTLLWVVTFSDK